MELKLIKTHILYIFILSLINFFIFHKVEAFTFDNIEVFTTDKINPIVLINKNKLEGISGEFLVESTKHQIKNLNLNILPWPRAQSELQKVKNSLILPLSRTKERESKYKWLSKVFDDPVCVFTSQPDLVVKTKEDLKKLKSIGVIRSGPEMNLLKGYPLEDSIDLNELAVKLNLHKVDAVVSGYSVTSYNWKMNNFDPSILKCDLIISINQQYIAASLSSDDNFVATLAKTMEKYKTTVEYKSLLKKYGVNSENKNTK